MRRAARLVIVAPDERVLLLHMRDPGRSPAKPSWEVPGGGSKPGEDAVSGLVREVAAEIVITGSSIRPPQWHRGVRFTWCGRSYHQRKTLHVAAPDASYLRAGEQRRTVAESDAVLEGMRRWLVADVVAMSGSSPTSFRLPCRRCSTADRSTSRGRPGR